MTNTVSIIVGAAALLASSTSLGGVAFADSAPTAPEVTDYVVQHQIASLKAVVLFPATNLAGQDAEVAAAQVASDFRSFAVTAVPTTHFTTYSVHMSAIDRGLNVDQTVTVADVTPPINAEEQGKKLADLIGADGYVLSSVDQQDVDTTARSDRAHVTFTLYSSNLPDPIRTVSVIGEAIAADDSEDMSAVEDRACLAAARRGFDGLYPGARLAQQTKNSHRK